MKHLQHVILVIGLMTSASATARDRMVQGFPDLPRDAAKVAERSLACLHLGGEINGTGDERDRWVAQQMRNLRCDRVEKDIAAIRHKYRHKPMVLEILSEATYE